MRPYFLLSFSRASRVRRPALFRVGRRFGSASRSALDMPWRIAPACPTTPPPETFATTLNCPDVLVTRKGLHHLVLPGLPGEQLLHGLAVHDHVAALGVEPDAGNRRLPATGPVIVVFLGQLGFLLVLSGVFVSYGGLLSARPRAPLGNDAVQAGPRRPLDSGFRRNDDWVNVIRALHPWRSSLPVSPGPEAAPRGDDRCLRRP